MSEKCIFVKVKLRSSKALVEQIDSDTYLVHLHSSPIKGSANTEMHKLLAGYFNVNISSVELISGFKSRHKKVKIYL